MKKILFILIAILVSGCGCILSQIPPQKIYAGAGCTAPIPNYLTKITATDNCEIASLTQIPAAGTLLTSSNKVATVTIKATDASGNFRQIVFTVTLLDTIKPVFQIDPTLAVIQLPKQIGELNNMADLMLEYNMSALDREIADTSEASVFPPSQYPNLRNVYQDSTYYKAMMITWTAKGHAKTGFGHRYTTFVNDADSIMLVRRKGH
jgi:hypothetical protein